MVGSAKGAVVFLAGLLAGAMNAAAGGGSFVTVPTLPWREKESATDEHR
jgi:uncharacterized membrane protein YfcA